MRKLSPKSIFLTAALALFLAIPASAQDAPAPEREFAADARPNLLKELGLSPDQVRRIRRTNQARRPLMEVAGQRLRDANRALDMAIYTDTLDENDVAARLRELQLAQAEVAKIRYQGELALRKVLSPEQLVKFREIRERFGRAREERQNRRRAMPPGDRPLQRIRQLPRRGDQP